MRSFRWTSTAVLLLAAMTAACQDLDVVNTNAPDRDRAQADPEAVYALVGSTYASLYTLIHRSTSHLWVMPNVADEFSGTFANAGQLEITSEPRPTFNNDPVSTISGVARFPWEYAYEAISNGVDAIAAIDGGLELIVGEDEEDFSERAVLWSLFNMATGHMYLGQLFDQAFIQTPADLNTPVDEREMAPYPEVLAHAIDMFDETIAYAEAHPDVTIPSPWFGPMRDGTELTAADIARFANHYAAKTMVYGARTPEERENLDWNEVIRRLDNGIEDTYWIYTNSSLWYLQNVRYLIGEGTFVSYGDARMVGPADVSGGYNNWLSLPWSERDRWDMVTPDLRYPQGNEHLDRGVYWEYDASNVFSPERGLYHRTFYQFESEYNSYGFIDHDHLPMVEANLFRAEALYFLGDLAGAADLINISRVGIGGLPPATAAGIGNDTSSCVPQKPTTGAQQCGDLYDALMWERMNELAAHESNRGYLDSRGFGRLQEGVFLHLPVPGRELGSLQIDVYTFGGVGGTDAAPPPIR
ncbi:MAG: hypothetical protein WEB88_10460 [Gemmatimonadota bacterium]